MAKETLKITVHEGEDIQDKINMMYDLIEKNILFDCAEITLDGTFRINKPICFKKGCDFPVTVKGNKTAVIDGGVHIKNFKKTVVNGVEAWCARIDKEIGQYIKFDQLFVDGKRRERTVYPENCFMGLTGVIFDGEKQKEVSLKEKEKYWCTSNAVFSYSQDLPKFTNVEDVTLMINHCWLHERLRIKEIDYDKKLIYTENASLFAAFPDEKIYFENVFEMLKKPGQCYFDKSEFLLYYIPVAGENIEDADVAVPITDAFIIVEENSNKHIDGINFCYCSGNYEYENILPSRSPWHTIETPRQGECEVPGSIQFINSKYCSVTNCTLKHIGRYGVEIAKRSSYISVCRNIFKDLGTGAIKNYRRDAYALRVPEDETHHVLITDNLISEYGRLYKAAVAVLLTDVNHYIVSHNEISYGEYSAVSCGWIWGYESSETSHNEISYNYIHHIGNNSVCDMGAIYMLGVQPGTVINNNVIHDVTDREENGWGIYLDEGSSYMTIENNLVYRVSTETMHIHYGENNRVVNNIFALGDVALLSNTRHEDHIQLILERNIFYSQNGHILRIKPGDGAMLSDKNLYFSQTGEIGFCRNNYEKDMVYKPIDEWKKTGNDRFSLIADPLFQDIENNDFTLNDNSPAFEIGFKMPDFSKAGIREHETE